MALHVDDCHKKSKKLFEDSLEQALVALSTEGVLGAVEGLAQTGSKL